VKEITDKAEELGKLIAASDQFKALAEIRTQADADAELQADLQAVQQLSQKIAALEKEVKPVEPEDKRALRELQAKVTGSAALQRLARAEADFAEVMNRVNRAIRGQLGT